MVISLTADTALWFRRKQLPSSHVKGPCISCENNERSCGRPASVDGARTINLHPRLYRWKHTLSRRMTTELSWQSDSCAKRHFQLDWRYRHAVVITACRCHSESRKLVRQRRAARQGRRQQNYGIYRGVVYSKHYTSRNGSDVYKINIHLVTQWNSWPHAMYFTVVNNPILGLSSLKTGGCPTKVAEFLHQVDVEWTDTWRQRMNRERPSTYVYRQTDDCHCSSRVSLFQSPTPVNRNSLPGNQISRTIAPRRASILSNRRD